MARARPIVTPERCVTNPAVPKRSSLRSRIFSFALRVRSPWGVAIVARTNGATMAPPKPRSTSGKMKDSPLLHLSKNTPAGGSTTFSTNETSDGHVTSAAVFEEDGEAGRREIKRARQRTQSDNS